MPAENLSGKKFNMLSVIRDSGERTPNRFVKWICRCDCGKETVVASAHLKGGYIKSCGCLWVKNTVKHRMSYSRVYRIWHGMIQRCENKNGTGYKNYGGRGIVVCKEWHESKKFIQWALSNGYQEHLTIERINNDGNYEPYNCKWITRSEQHLNQRHCGKIKHGKYCKDKNKIKEFCGLLQQREASK